MGSYPYSPNMFPSIGITSNRWSGQILHTWVGGLLPGLMAQFPGSCANGLDLQQEHGKVLGGNLGILADVARDRLKRCNISSGTERDTVVFPISIPAFTPVPNIILLPQCLDAGSRTTSSIV